MNPTESTNFHSLGTIRGIQLLKFECSVCGKRADYAVERTNDALPKPYYTEGTRSIYYCAEHFAEDKEATALWTFTAQI
jgi:hypothetical protein